MASFDTEVSVSVTGFEEPIREIKAAVTNVADTIVANRKLGWLMILLTLLNLTTLFLGEWADKHSLELIIATAVVLVAFLFLGRRKPHNKEN